MALLLKQPGVIVVIDIQILDQGGRGGCNERTSQIECERESTHFLNNFLRNSSVVEHRLVQQLIEIEQIGTMQQKQDSFFEGKQLDLYRVSKTKPQPCQICDTCG